MFWNVADTQLVGLLEKSVKADIAKRYIKKGNVIFFTKYEHCQKIKIYQKKNLSNTANLPRLFGSAIRDATCFGLEDSTTQQGMILETQWCIFLIILELHHFNSFSSVVWYLSHYTNNAFTVFFLLQFLSTYKFP